MGFLDRFFRKERPSTSPTEPPIGYADLKSLFEYLDRPDPPPCSNMLKETRDFLEEHGLPVEPTVAWLEENGGYCDCEVIYNVANNWGDKVAFEPNIEDEELLGD